MKVVLDVAEALAKVRAVKGKGTMSIGRVDEIETFVTADVKVIGIRMGVAVPLMKAAGGVPIRVKLALRTRVHGASHQLELKGARRGRRD